MAEPLTLLHGALSSQDPVVRNQFAQAIIEQPACQFHLVLRACGPTHAQLHLTFWFLIPLQHFRPYVRPFCRPLEASTPLRGRSSSETSLKWHWAKHLSAQSRKRRVSYSESFRNRSSTMLQLRFKHWTIWCRCFKIPTLPFARLLYNVWLQPTRSCSNIGEFAVIYSPSEERS